MKYEIIINKKFIKLIKNFMVILIPWSRNHWHRLLALHDHQDRDYPDYRDYRDYL